MLTLLVGSAAYADSFKFSTDSMTTVLAKGKEHTILTGNAEITNGDTTITADRIELYGTNFRYAQGSGNVRVVDEKQGITLTSNNLFYDRTDNLSRVQGYAVMTDTKNQIVVKGGFLENRGKEEITIVEIDVRILKVADNQRMACRSEFAQYNRKTDMLQLSGAPVVNWKGDTYQASRITINLKTDEIRLEGDVSGQVVSEGSNSGSTSGAASSSTSPPAQSTTTAGTSSSPSPPTAPSTTAPAGNGAAP